MLRQFVLAVSVARSVIAPPVPLPQERSALGRLPGLALQFASHDYSYDEELVRSARATGNYYKNGQCRQKADGTPQWRKKKKNSWHDCGDHTICEEGSVGCECQAGYQGDAVKYPTCTACSANSVAAKARCGRDGTIADSTQPKRAHTTACRATLAAWKLKASKP